jgi:hypothetical protein
LSSGADNRRALVSPYFWINMAPVFCNHVQCHIEFAFLWRKLVSWHGRKPDIDIEPDLMAGMAGEHGSAAWLGHIADQQPGPSDVLRLVSQPLNEGHKARVSPVPISRYSHDLPVRAANRERDGTRKTTIGIGAD